MQKTFCEYSLVYFQKRIYTVPFDELEESVASSPDILRDVRQQPMLQINWLERHSVRTW